MVAAVLVRQNEKLDFCDGAVYVGSKINCCPILRNVNGSNQLGD